MSKMFNVNVDFEIKIKIRKKYPIGRISTAIAHTHPSFKETKTGFLWDF